MNNLELRLGNVVFNPNGKQDTVHALSGANLWLQWHKEAEYDDIKPIQLTEEWLVKMGFRKNEYNWFKPINNVNGEPVFFFSLVLSEGDFYFVHAGLPLLIIQFVHQLQNLFYDLTREELKYERD